MEQLEQRISSREVAEMMEMNHKELLRKIDGINNDFIKLKIQLIEYWTESQYKDGSGRLQREYQITQRGAWAIFDSVNKEKKYQLAPKIIRKFGDERQITLIPLSRKETEFAEELKNSLIPFGITGIAQYEVLKKYRIDYYIPKLNIAIEYDENGHAWYSYEAQELRQKKIEKELGCRFIRVNDNETNSYNIGYVIKNIFDYKTNGIVPMIEREGQA